MRISFGRTGNERKALVAAISEALGAEAKYLGAPTFSYEVGGCSIDKDGTLTGRADKKLIAALEAQGFTGAEAGAEGPRYTEEEFGLGRKRTDHPGEDGMQASDAPEQDGDDGGAEDGRITIELPLEGYTPEVLDNLTKMVTAKEALLKLALGADDLPIQVAVETIGFPWFTVSEPGEALYYAQFVSALCRAAKEKKRVMAKEREVGNPKYAMRCWLLSLGLIGDEYKAARKLLLSRLSGNGSFKGGSRPTYTAQCFTYPNGIEGEAMDCEGEEFTSLAKAKAHVDAFAAGCEGIKFAGAHVEDGSGRHVYELLCG
jgi:hypothetical protein